MLVSDTLMSRIRRITDVSSNVSRLQALRNVLLTPSPSLHADGTFSLRAENDFLHGSSR
jgi:hypothetical protein